MNSKVGIVKNLRVFVACALTVAFAALIAAGPTQTAMADSGGVKGHTFDVTFTKWVTNYPNMVGVVGGAVGSGAYAGEILTYVDDGVVTKIEALYHMNGSRHSFTADVHVIESDSTGMASITGRVTKGWLQGSPVTGEFRTLATCQGNPSGPCYQGALHIQRPSED
jgi:hypothetical protein